MKYFVVAMALWSCGIAWAIPHSPFALLSKEEKSRTEKCGSEAEVQNMPRFRSQDSVPICKAMVAATMAQFQLCKKTGIENCAAIPQDQEVSPLSMLAWIRTDKGMGVHESRNHENLDFLNLRGGAVDALKNSLKSFVFLSDSCFPLDQVANRFGDSRDEKMESLLNNIKNEYTRAKTEGAFCEDCLAGSVSELGIDRSLADLKNKIDASTGKDDTPEEFLYSVLMGGCSSKKLTLPPSRRPKVDSYPKENELAVGVDDKSQKKNYESMMSKVKSVLGSGNPIAFDGVCLRYDGSNCTGGHSVTISGYRKVCKKSSKCEADCRELLKVHNSWGADWQKNNDDGWVDAKSLLSFATSNPKLMSNAFSWYY